MLRLTRLRIDEFRNVRPGTELHFGPTFNLLLGKNATGKTTLLNLIAAVTGDELANFEEPLAVEFETETTRSRVVGRLRRRSDGERWISEFRLEDWVAGLAATTLEADRSSLRLVHDNRDELEVPTDPSGKYPFTRALLRLREAFGEAAPAFLAFAPGPRKRFDEALGTFNAIRQSRFEVTREGASVKTKGDWWLPLGLFDVGAVLDATSPSAELPLKLNGYSAAGHAELVSLLGFERMFAYARVASQRRDRVEVEGLEFRFERRDGSSIKEQRLSFGQKRLFAFLWYLGLEPSPADPSPVVADELMNGLHHEWIKACVERLYDRQSFLATQHPYLLDHVPIESVESVRRSFVRCTLETDAEGREEMVWRNFTAEEAKRFFVACETGIQHVSEVLRTEELW